MLSNRMIKNWSSNSLPKSLWSHEFGLPKMQKKINVAQVRFTYISIWEPQNSICLYLFSMVAEWWWLIIARHCSWVFWSAKLWNSNFKLLQYAAKEVAVRSVASEIIWSVIRFWSSWFNLFDCLKNFLIQTTWFSKR